MVKGAVKDKMTSTYDAFAYLCFEAKGASPIKPLILILYDYAISELNKVDRDKLCWAKWVENNGLVMYVKLYGGDGELMQKATFLADAHSQLDHTREYHCKTINHNLNLIVGRFRDWFVTYKDRDYNSRFYGLIKFRKPVRDKYPKIFKELKRLIAIGVIKLPDWDKRAKKKVEKW